MISLIGHHLQEKGCKVVFSNDEADVLITEEAFAEVLQHCIQLLERTLIY